MRRLNPFTIDVPLAACIVDATLFQKRHPDYAELSLLLNHLRDDDDTTILDLTGRLVPVLLEIVRHWPHTMMERLRAALDDDALDEMTRERHLRSEISTADLRRISAIRILGLIRNPGAIKALREILLDPAESISLRVTALRSLAQVDESKFLAAIRELLGRPSRATGIGWRMIHLDSPQGTLQSGSAEEPELLLRESLDEVGRLASQAGRRFLLQVLRDRKIPLTLRQFAFDIIHAGQSSSAEAGFNVTKVVSYLK